MAVKIVMEFAEACQTVHDVNTLGTELTVAQLVVFIRSLFSTIKNVDNGGMLLDLDHEA